MFSLVKSFQVIGLNFKILYTRVRDWDKGWIFWVEWYKKGKTVALWENFSGGAKVKNSKMAPLNFQIAPPQRSLIGTNLRMTIRGRDYLLHQSSEYIVHVWNGGPTMGWGRLENKKIKNGPPR